MVGDYLPRVNSRLRLTSQSLVHPEPPLKLLRRPAARLRFSQPRRKRRQRPERPFRCKSEEHTSELQSLMRISYAVFCLKKKTQTYYTHTLLRFLFSTSLSTSYF